MIGVSNWKERKQRYEQFWNRENPVPLLHVTAPLDPSRKLPEPDLKTKWFDEQWFLKNARETFANTYFGGVAYPHVMPSLGPDLICGIAGCELQFDRNTSWAKHLEVPMKCLESMPLDQNNRWFLLMEKFLHAYTEDAKNGDYIVGMVDLNTMADGVSSMIGPERLCLELYDDPDGVKKAFDAHVGLYRQVFEHYDRIVRRYQGGTTNWLSIYSDTPWYFVSVDFIVMLSDSDFMEFIAPPLCEIASYHPRLFLHLDGENAVRHLDRILEIPQIHGVQVQATPEAHTAQFWAPYIRKIQKSGKCVHIEAKTMDDLRVLHSECAPEGLFIKMAASDADFAAKAESI